MRSILKFTCFICLVSILTSCGSGGGSAWVKHDIPEGGFSILMPKDIKKTDRTEVTAFGKQATHFVTWKPATLSMDKFNLFQIRYMDCPANVAADSNLLNTMLDSATEMRKKDFNDPALIESQVIELNGYPGRAFLYDVPKGSTVVTVKICVANNRMYDLVVIAKKNYATSTEMGNFFNSFIVNK